MELEKFIADFAEEFTETNPDEFTPDTDYKQLEEWFSLTAILVVSMIDVKYGVVVSTDIFNKCKTIEDLFNMVKALKK